MKRISLLFAILMMSSLGFAQGKYGADSAKCVRNLSLYRDYYKQKVYEDAYKYWKIVYTICPSSSERMYVDGANLVEYKIKKSATDEERAAYVDTLKMVYDQRIANFGKEGYVLGRKGTDMLRYDQKNIEEVYSTLKKSIDLQANKSGAGAIVSAMNAAVLMEKKELLGEEEVVAMFGQLSDILAAAITRYEGKKTQEYYLRAQEGVEKVAAPYLNCEVLVKMANDNYEKNKDNADWMERTANLLDNKKCTDAPIFFTIAKQMHSSNPSAVSAEKMGVMSLKNKKYQEAVNYFKQAIELAEDEKKMADYYIELAQAYSSMGSYSAARQNARKSAQLDPNDGLPYIMIGDMIAGSGSVCDIDDACKKKALYWLATDYYQKAKSVDPSMSGKANGKIATYSQYYPTKEECFFLGIKDGDTVEIGCWIGESTKARF